MAALPDPQPIIDHFKSLARGPYGTAEALETLRAGTEGENTVEHIIVGVSEVAWRAYFAANKAAKTTQGFAGQAGLMNLISALNTLTPDQLHEFAVLLNEGLTLAGEDNVSQRTAKRRRTDKRPRAESSRTESGCMITAHTHTKDRIPDSPNSRSSIYLNASLKAARGLFPIQLIDSIQRIPHSRDSNILVADIAIFVQEGPTRQSFRCQIEIGIGKEKVPRYASNLFNTVVEINEGVRYIYNKDTKYEPDPSVKIRSYRRDAIGVFGEEVIRGITASPIYLREDREEREYTNGVVMTFTNRADDCGKITLFLGEFQAFGLKEKLEMELGLHRSTA